MSSYITEDELLTSADNLAEAATSFAGQGYKMFIEARQSFIDLLHKFIEEHEFKDGITPK